MEALRLASRDHLMCMMELSCSGELESVAGGRARVRIVGRLHSEALLDSKVSFCSRMKPLVDNLLRLNTEEGRLVIVETELEAFGCLLEQRCP